MKMWLSWTQVLTTISEDGYLFRKPTFPMKKKEKEKMITKSENPLVATCTHVFLAQRKQKELTDCYYLLFLFNMRYKFLWIFSAKGFCIFVVTKENISYEVSLWLENYMAYFLCFSNNRKVIVPQVQNETMFRWILPLDLVETGYK